MKKIYSREEKIKYYQRRVLNLEFALQRAQDRLHYLNSEEYQDYNSALDKQLSKKPRGTKIA